jgi:hypothetical protein
LSNHAQNSPEERLKELEIEFKIDTRRRRRKREIVHEAADLCLEHEIPYPEWLDLWHLHRDPFREHASSLKNAFDAGNLGALKDMVYWSHQYSEPLPEWAVRGLYDALDTLAKNNKPKLKAWRTWFRGYRKKQDDYEVWDTVKEARGEYLEKGDDRKPVEWADVYEIAGAIIANQHPEDAKISANTVKKAYNRADKGLEKNPLQYMQLISFMDKRPGTIHNSKLWNFILETVKAGNPRKKRNSQKN